MTISKALTEIKESTCFGLAYSEAVEVLINFCKKAQGKFVVYKDGTWIYLKDGISWEFEGDKDFLLTIDLSQERSFVDYKDYPGNKDEGGQNEPKNKNIS